MGSFLQKKRKSLWRADRWLALVVLVVMVGLHQATDVIAMLERRLYDAASTSSARFSSADRIAVIAIDDESIANIGRWPWPRDLHARLIDQLASAGAKTIVHTTFFFEPQVDRGLNYIRRMRQLLPPGASGGLTQLVDEAERALDTDARLADSMRRAGNVLVPVVLALGEPLGRPDRPLAPWLEAAALPNTQGYSLPAREFHYPIESIGRAAAGLGHLNQIVDVDGAVRQVPLLVDFHGHTMPSIALLAVARELNLRPGDIRLVAGQEIQLGRLRVRTDEQARMLPRFYAREGGKPVFPMDSFHDVLSGKINTAKYSGKTVLIGATAAGVGTTYAVPDHPSLAPVEMLAHITSSILREHAIIQPSWALATALFAVLAVTAYLFALLPRLSARQGATATAVMFIALLGSEFLLLSRTANWLQLVFPATLLLAGHLALTTRRFLVTEAGKQRADDESAETNRMMGMALQGQGQLDMAFDRFRRVPLGEAVMDNLYNLGLDFERKRQFNKAQAVYQHMATWDPDYKDLPTRLSRAKGLSDTVILSGAAGHPGGTLILEDGAVEKPMLGRYQLEKELGKGAMGMVYLGRDPRIGRTVAIKTLALRQEFEGAELEEARHRFFREAETAGRLAHPNIVTIFDAGEEHDLAYIAMEFLRGRDLAGYCQPAALLAPATVVSIAARVAEALAYAHSQGVVHRDIKPANIMYEPEGDGVKVTDFGIARITDASRTRTGTILGTPSFMSPEQIAGRAVDGRSDLYALGVTLFQLLTGELPFQGDSLAQVMYRIANEEAPALRSIRPDLPEPLERAVAHALAKDVQARVPDGLSFAAQLRACAPLLAGLDAAAPAPGRDRAGGYDAKQPPASDLAPSPTEARMVQPAPLSSTHADFHDRADA